MDINNLKKEWSKNKQREFKYKELLEILKEEQKSSGKSRNYQFQDWKRYFNFYKPNPKGQKFVITEIYDKPKSKVDGRGLNPNSHGNANIYGKYIDTTLINFLSNVQDTLNKNEEMYFTASVLAQYSYMVNRNYTTAKNNRQKFYQYLHSKNKKINPTEVKDVILSLSDTVRSVINSALDRLQRVGMINFEQGYVVVEKECEYKIHTRMATDVELKNIKMWEDEILKDLKTEKGKVRFSNKKLNKFYFELDNKIKSEYPYIEQVFQGYKIKVLSKIKISDSKFKNAKEKLNKVVIEETLKKCKRKKDKTIKENSGYFGLPNPMWDRWILDRLDKNYMSNAEEVINTVVKTVSKDITTEIKNVEITSKKPQKIKKRKKDDEITKGMYDDFIRDLCVNDRFSKDDAISLYPFEDIKRMVG